MEIEEINSLIPKLFLGIGDLLRDSLMTPEVFQDHLQAIGEDLLGRIDEYRRKIGDANWEKTVNAIAGIKALPRLEITEGDHQAEFTVPFPVKNTQLEPEHHSYIRYFPDLCSKQLEIEDNTLLQELQDRSRKVVGDICNT